MWHCLNLVCGPEGMASGVLLRAGEIEVGSGPRAGVGGDGAHHPWRFWIDGDRTVSPYRAHVPRRRPS